MKDAIVLGSSSFKVSAEKRARRIRLDNIDLELIGQVLNLKFDEKIAVLKYIRSL